MFVSLPWGSCHPWSKTSLCRSCQYEQQSSGPMEWYWLYYWFHKVIAAVSGTLQGIQNLFKEFFIISKKYFLITIYFFTRGVDSQFAEIPWIKYYYKLMKGNSTRNDPVIIWCCPEDLNQQASLSVLSFYNPFSGVWSMNRIYHTSGKFNGSALPSTTSLSWIKLGNSLINRGLYT